MKKAIARVIDRLRRTVARARQRWEPLDHGFRAWQRYGDAHGGRLAAAMAYYGFFATFALGVLAYSVLGYLVEYQVDVRDTVEQFLQENLPGVQPGQITAGRGAAGVFGLVGMLLTGLGWVEALRSSQRQVWEVEQQPGSVIKRRLVDVGLLAGLALLLGLSLAVTGLIGYLLGGLAALRPVGWLLLAGVNLVLAVALLAGLPRLRIPLRRLLPAAIAVAIGLVVLNTLGRAYIARVQANPAYAVVATAAGLLVYLYLVHQLLLLAAAWAATGRHGQVADPVTGNPAPPAAGEAAPAGAAPAGYEPARPPGATPARSEGSAGTPPGGGRGG